MANLIVSDIDGVIANCEHRLQWAKAKLYDDFYSRVSGDEIIPDGVNLLRRLTLSSESGEDELVFLTGRRDTCRSDTVHWLSKKFVYPYSALYMRKDGDHREPYIVKKELYDEIIRMYESRNMSFDHIFYIDDDPENVKMICDNDENVTGLVYGTKRLSKEEDEGEN